MVKRLRTFERVFRGILGFAAGTLLVGIVLINVIDVVGRALYDSPLRGSYELTQLAIVGSVFLGLAFTESTRSHIKVDLLYEWLRPKYRLVVDLIAGLFTLIVITTLGWQLVGYAGLLQDGGRVTGVLEIPLSFVVWLAVIGTVAYFLAALSALADLVISRDEPEDKAPDLLLV